MSALTGPLMRYHGGKYRLAPWIMAHFPAHRIYVEPFGGAASVLMCKPRSPVEVYNDLDGELVNVMRVLQDPAQRARLSEQIALTPYARDEFKDAWQPADDPVERARRILIRAQMGFGSGGATQGITGFRFDTQRLGGSNMHRWAALPDRLAAFASRLQGVLVENCPALQVLRDHDSPQTLFYVDPPYLPATRRLSGAVYRHEMSEADHAELLDALGALKGSTVLSGYPHPLYDEALRDWRRVETAARISSQRGSAARTEVLWLSPNVPPPGLNWGEAA
jgi:DNA adenine methylase